VSRTYLLSVAFLAALAATLGFGNGAFWPQWGHDPQHTGMVNVAGQALTQRLADIVYDPFVAQEKASDFGALAVHYEATLVDGDSFYMMQKSGTYLSCPPTTWFLGTACGPNTWNKMIWSVVRYKWVNGTATPVWTFTTDWKPEPNATNYAFGYEGLDGEEPVFHPALANGQLYVPGAGGTIWKVDLNTGKAVSHINPFSGISITPSDTYVSGPLSVDAYGQIYFNTIELNTKGNPWNQNDVAGAWLAKVGSDDSSSAVTYASLVPNAPLGTSTNCPGTFLNLNDFGASLPWPPVTPPTPPTQLCGSQRPPLNVAPAISTDGTIYTASVAHFDPMVLYLVAVNPNLTTKWAASLQNRLNDGCGVLLPIAPPGVDNMPNSCRYGTTKGVDPTTNAMGSGVASDDASSSPTLLPDGSIIFGAEDNYNYYRGHLFHFDAEGNYINAFPFGWDTTPAVYTHDNTYSIILKDNSYGLPAYCLFPTTPVCSYTTPGPYYLTQLDANLNREWSFQNTTIDSLHPNGYEWCINAPAIDQDGIVYGNSEDGNLYSIPQGYSGVFTTPRQKLFLNEAVSAAYTSLSIGPDGKLYAQNDGHLIAVGGVWGVPPGP
jgi:hypothetical protein